MAGFKVAAGDPILHLGLFIATLYIPKKLICDGVDYGNTVLLLCIAHAVNSARFIIKFTSE